MATVLFKGTPVRISGEMPKEGQLAPFFSLVKNDLSLLNSQELKGKKILLNIFPSVDTGVCSASARTFNEALQQTPDCIGICVSMDLPFAQKRFCDTEGISSVLLTSDFRDHRFAQAYGLRIEEGPLTGLLARAVLIIDEDGKVIYKELVSEVTNEPNYRAALAALS